MQQCNCHIHNMGETMNICKWCEEKMKSIEKCKCSCHGINIRFIGDGRISDCTACSIVHRREIGEFEEMLKKNKMKLEIDLLNERIEKLEQWATDVAIQSIPMEKEKPKQTYWIALDKPSSGNYFVCSNAYLTKQEAENVFSNVPDKIVMSIEV